MNGLLTIRVWCPSGGDEPEHPNAADDDPENVAERHAEERWDDHNPTVQTIHVRGADGAEHVFDVEATMEPVFRATRRPS